MHRLEITGTTPDELYFNIVKTLSIFLQGATAPVSSRQVEEVPSEAAVSSTSDAAPSEQEVLPPVKSRRNKKSAEPIKVEGNLNDSIHDLTGGAEPVKELTLAGDIIPRLMAIQAAHTKRGNDMPTCVKYIQHLYGPFGIANAKNLKPEQFAEFMEASEAYLSGEA